VRAWGVAGENRGGHHAVANNGVFGGLGNDHTIDDGSNLRVAVGEDGADRRSDPPQETGGTATPSFDLGNDGSIETSTRPENEALAVTQAQVHLHGLARHDEAGDGLGRHGELELSGDHVGGAYGKYGERCLLPLQAVDDLVGGAVATDGDHTMGSGWAANLAASPRPRVTNSSVEAPRRRSACSNASAMRCPRPPPATGFAIMRTSMSPLFSPKHTAFPTVGRMRYHGCPSSMGGP
jgi:hypothetical protein